MRLAPRFRDPAGAAEAEMPRPLAPAEPSPDLQESASISENPAETVQAAETTDPGMVTNPAVIDESDEMVAEETADSAETHPDGQTDPASADAAEGVSTLATPVEVETTDTLEEITSPNLPKPVGVPRVDPTQRGVRPIRRPRPPSTSRTVLVVYALMVLLTVGLGIWGWNRRTGAEEPVSEATPTDVTAEATLADATPAAAEKPAEKPAEAANPAENKAEAETPPVPTEAVLAAVAETSEPTIHSTRLETTVVEPVKAETTKAEVRPESIPAAEEPTTTNRPSFWLRCPAGSCERIGNLVMVNRGPLQVYGDPNCKRPVKALIAVGQTLTAEAKDCFPVELPW